MKNIVPGIQLYILAGLAFMSVCCRAQNCIPPGKSRLPARTIPAGYDAYLQWSRLPIQRIGVRAYMRSTYDRTGGPADASHFLFMNGEDENVTLDVKGRGILYFFRANHWHGSPWHFTVDGDDHIVEESATADPVHAEKVIRQAVFIPGGLFPEPLNWTWTATKGADLIWTPMPFQASLRVAYARTFYGTGYYIYHLYSDDESLSRPVGSWNKAAPDARVIDLLKRAGSDIAPRNIHRKAGKVRLDRGQVLLAEINAPHSSVRAFKLSIPLNEAERLERVRLEVVWDGARYPSIDAPLCLFFGAGTLYNREKKADFVKGLPFTIHYDFARQKVELACYYPMPFFRTARFALTGITPGDGEISYEIRYEPMQQPARLNSYFHATYKDIPAPEPGKDMTWLDTRGTEGCSDWSGSFLGTSFIFSHNADLFTLEGDPRFFFDDSRTPQAYGTGTEEWAGGGDYWGGENMTLPLAGHPCGASKKETAVNEKDLIQSAYRFLVADLMPFGRRAVIRFEHSENVSVEHYEAVTYWYGIPVPSLVETDSIDIGDLSSERQHAYYSPRASGVQLIRSRFEWGADTFPAHVWGEDLSKIQGYNALSGKEIYPAFDEDGRYTRGSSEFSVSLRPDNAGVLLRRMLDYSFPNQTAEVWVMAAKQGAPAGAAGDTVRRKQGRPADDTVWRKAGIWYLAGSNTCMFSRPGSELGKRIYDVQTSDRRFRDDEFLIPARLTADCAAIRIRIRFIRDDQPLYPGHDFPEKSAWSELSYQVYSYVLPGLN